MSDSYQAIYDAVRSRISNANIGEAVAKAAHSAFDISHQVAMISGMFQGALSSYDRVSAIYRPRLFIDGDQWCALYGENLQDGLAGFGETPDKAMWDFDKNWHNMKPPQRTTAADAINDIRKDLADIATHAREALGK